MREGVKNQMDTRLKWTVFDTKTTQSRKNKMYFSPVVQLLFRGKTVILWNGIMVRMQLMITEYSANDFLS